MCAENKNAKCFYVIERPWGSACGIMDAAVNDIFSADIRFCLSEHFNICSVYRGYNEDYIDV